MSQLRLVKPEGNQRQLTVDELLALLGPDKLNAIDAKARIMREKYTCPFTVRDYDGFKDALVDFFAHYYKAFFNADIKQPDMDREFWKQQAYKFAQEHLGGGNGGLHAAERNAITGREGGMIAVIDTLYEAIVKLHTETYVRSVFFESIAPSDFDTRLRLAEELLKRYGQFLFPGEQLVPYYILAGNIEQLIQGFATHLHTLRKQWRY